MVTIRFSRAGMLKRPFYHIVVTDSRNRRDGRYIERVGYYNPIAKGADVPVSIKLDRLDYWLSKGAQTSETVANLLKKYRAQQPTAAPAT
ncbi:30S ribosomal subunit protein S16 [Gammaproteobacteria bacterium]